jgi:hypothetical protein
VPAALFVVPHPFTVRLFQFGRLLGLPVVLVQRLRFQEHEHWQHHLGRLVHPIPLSDQVDYFLLGVRPGIVRDWGAAILTAYRQEGRLRPELLLKPRIALAEQVPQEGLYDAFDVAMLG